MSDRQANHYTQTWFDLFLAGSDPVQTAREVAFLTSVLPRRDGAQVLDVCCGYGRHAASLASAGYSVLGVDRDEGVIARAQAMHETERLSFSVRDMCDLHELPPEFDAVICMWQSFGYFDAATNKNVLSQMAARLHPGGRLVLDVYNRDFFESRQCTRASLQRGVDVATSQRMEGERLVVELEYRERQERDVFDWQLFTPQSITDLAASCALHAIVVCAGFDETVAPSPEEPRMQVVLEKR